VVGATIVDGPGAVEDVTPAGALVVVVACSPVATVVDGAATALVGQSTTGSPSIESSARTAVAETHDRAARSVGLRSSTQTLTLYGSPALTFLPSAGLALTSSSESFLLSYWT